MMAVDSTQVQAKTSPNKTINIRLERIKAVVDKIEEDAAGLEPDLKKKMLAALDDVRKKVVNAQSIISSYYSEKENLDKMQSVIRDRAVKSPVYRDLDDRVLNKIINSVITKGDTELLTKEQFNQVATKYLRQLDTAELVPYSFSKEHMIKYGGHSLGDEATEMAKYKKGLELLSKSIQTPSGFEEALAYALRRVGSNKKLKTKILRNYHGV